MTYINNTTQVCTNQFILLKKYHSVIETLPLKNVVSFIQTILSFVLSKKNGREELKK